MCLLPMDMLFLLLGKENLSYSLMMWHCVFLFFLFSCSRFKNSPKHLIVVLFFFRKKTIGEGFFLQGLYYISGKFLNTKSSAIATFYSSLIDYTLWHQHLAHPSKNVLTKLFPHFEKESISCDTCHFSKSTRLPFISS